MLISILKLNPGMAYHDIKYRRFDKIAAKQMLTQLYKYFNMPEEIGPKFEVTWQA